MKAQQTDLFVSNAIGDVSINPDFDGSTYERNKDHKRLSGQLQGVFDLVKDGRKRTLFEIHLAVGGSEAGVSARLRDLRKEKFGGFNIQRERQTDGVWLYWMEGLK